MDFLINMDYNNIDSKIEKNILDLNYNKYLQYKVTSIIVATTYLFAVTIALITNELKLDNYLQMTVLAILSIVVLTPCIYFVISSGKHLKRILNLIRELKIN